MELYWDGATSDRSFNERFTRYREAVRDACLAGDWASVLEAAGDDFGTANAACLGDPDWRTPLHVAVESGAPIAEVRQLIEAGALRSIRDRRALRPVDVIAGAGDTELIAMLEPVPLRWVPTPALERLQAQLHRLIDERADFLVEKHELRLPQLSALLESAEPTMWFPVPGMYGGFRLELVRDGDTPLLKSSSACRVVGGSGQRHEVTPDGYALVEEGHV